MTSLQNNQIFFYDLNNDVIEFSLRKTILEKLERDIDFRCDTDNEKLLYLRKIKQDLVDTIDKETCIGIHQLIDIEFKKGKYVLNKNQFFDFIEFFLKTETDIEAEITETLKGLRFRKKPEEKREIIGSALNKYNSIAPEQLTRLSFLMYCLNTKIAEAQPDIFKPNLTVFKDTRSHLFFDFLYRDWLKQENKCRPQLSYIVSEMRKKESELSITCPSLEDFAQFWNNNYSHPYRLTFKKSKINLSDEPSKKYETAFDNRKKYFLDELIKKG